MNSFRQNHANVTCERNPEESKCNQRPDDSRRVRKAATLEERTREGANGCVGERRLGDAGLKKSHASSWPRSARRMGAAIKEGGRMRIELLSLHFMMFGRTSSPFMHVVCPPAPRPRDELF